MKRIMLIISLIIATSSIFATTITVNQDGSADYTQINLAVANSVDGDTIKVFPGSYEGNIVLENRHNLTIASLYLWTEIDSFKISTVIDGGMQDFGFRIELSSDITIQGFTITHCIAPPPLYDGAAINTKRSNPVKIYDNIITENHASWGAGINASSNYPENINYIDLKRCEIIKNYAGAGAGLFISQHTQVTIDENSHNSIHSNYASWGADLFWDGDYQTTIYLDTLSISDEDDNFSPYYFYDREGTCELEVLNYKFELIERDIYVDAEIGDNENSGTEAEPMKTITHALSMIKSNSINSHNIFVNSGIYYEESCSLPFKTNVNLSGISENVFIDYNEKYFFSIISGGTAEPSFQDISISDFNIINISNKRLNIIHLTNADNVIFKNLYFENLDLNGNLFQFIYKQNSNSQVCMNNVHSINSINRGIVYNRSQNLDIINCSFKNSIYNSLGEGGVKEVISLYGYTYDPVWPEINIINTEITNNEAANNWPYEVGAKTGISTGYMTNVNIINSTIANNVGVPSYYHPGGEVGKAIMFWKKDSYVSIVNSIIYGNDEFDIGYKDSAFYDENNNYSLNVVNSIVGNHEIDISDNQIYFTNVCSEDPQFAGDEAEYPFALMEASIAIDAGAMNYQYYLPADFEFPTTDLAGNPRISGDGIDIGAYEYQQESSAPEVDIYQIENELKISNYPNPGRLNFRGEIATRINLNLIADGEYELEIYNIKGQMVKRILTAYLASGNHSFSWDGRDSNDKIVGSGNYLIKLSQQGKIISTHQATMLK